MSVPTELRVTARDVAASRRWPTCRACRNVRPDKTGCSACDGWGVEDTGYGVRLRRGASARLGAMLVEAMPHLRHATWPPKKRGGLAAAISLVGTVRP